MSIFKERCHKYLVVLIGFSKCKINVKVYLKILILMVSQIKFFFMSLEFKADLIFQVNRFNMCIVKTYFGIVKLKNIGVFNRCNLNIQINLNVIL